MGPSDRPASSDGGELPTAPAAARTDELGDDVALGSGARISRYVVSEKIGSGGMGVVFRARDPELDRDVAIKVLRPSRGSSGSTEHTARLMREAQALARVSHPNVVNVYDVGAHDGHVFIAMELVEGETLRAWTRRERRPWRAVLAAYRQAAAGLIAIHRHGIVHRDFKPGNVMVGRDGRLRVMDLGLAIPMHRRAPTRRGETAEADVPAGSSGTAFDENLTETGMMMGTPAYMSPEQLRGDSVDARTDQFAFCVALYEGLHGARPFASTDDEPRLAAIARGVSEAPGTDGIPARIDRAVRRGLAYDLDARWPSMDALVAALAPGSQAVRRWAIAGAVAAVTAVAILVSASPDSHCSDVRGLELAGWTNDDQRAIERAFDDSGLLYAEDSWIRVQSVLDEHAQAWSSTYRHVCDEVSGTTRDYAMACLHGDRSQLAGIVGLLSEADAEVVEHATEVVGALRDPAQCLDGAPEIDETVDAAATAGLRTQLARTYALQAAFKHDQAEAEAAALLAGARAVGAAGLEVEALFALGSNAHSAGRFRRARQYLHDASYAAQAIGADLLAAEAASALVDTLNQQAEYDAALEWARRAQAKLGTDRRSQQTRGRVLHNRGLVHTNLGDYDRARDSLERALELQRSLFGDEHGDVARSYIGLGSLASILGEHERARDHWEAALAIREKLDGPQHPTTAHALNNLGNVARALGDHTRSIELHERVLEIRTGALSPDHDGIGVTLGNLATAYAVSGALDKSIPYFERALVLMERTYGPVHPRVAMWCNNLGLTYLRLQHFDRAEPYLRRGVEIRTHARVDALEVAISVGNLGHVELARERLDSARAHFERALAMYALRRDDHPNSAYPRSGLGRVALRQGKLDEAAEHLDEAQSLIERSHGDDWLEAETLFATARVVWQSGGDRARALATARAARALADKPTFPPHLRREIERWLAQPR